MRRLLTGLTLALLIAYPCALLAAHVRLIHPTNGAALRWSAPANIGIVIGAGSGDIGDGSHTTGVRLAIQEWNAVTGTMATLVEDDSAASRARTDWRASDVHLVLFDESNSSGYFPPGSATVALTPVWFAANGVIQDADVLFNGAGFTFTTGGEPWSFDVADVAAHELGHLLGLDHSGVASATMYPYVDQGLVLQRSLSADELAGLRDAYPAGAYGQITGSVERLSDGTPVAGAYLVARDAFGRTRASILADAGGAFALRGLAPGTYTVYARPLDGIVTEGNLGPGYGGEIDTDFEPAAYASPATITGANTVALGPLAVGEDVALSLGTIVDLFPMRAVAGATGTIVLHGSGLFTGSTIEASDPDLLLGTPVWLGTQVSFQLTVPAGEPRGEVDLTVTNASGRIAILSAALEITPPTPTVLAVVPGRGRPDGGDALTLTGTSFGPGARVVIGERIYTDGIEASVLDASTITLTTAATAPGKHDVVVIDASGVEGRLADGFQVLGQPELDRVLPRAGGAGGGSTVLLAGQGFEAGMKVRIDGLDQGPVTVESLARASFTTKGGAAGGPYALELENPDGSRASLTFSYVSQYDPRLTDLAPANGSTGGGTLLTLTGRDFTPAMDVWFYDDLAAEPVPAASVTFVDANTLQVRTPVHAAGLVSLLVAEPSGCGVMAENAFTFTGGGGGGGGGCSLATVDRPREPRSWLANGWWMLAVLVLLGLRARGARPDLTSA